MATTALYTNAASVKQAAPSTKTLPSGIKSYEAELAKPKASSTTANQQDFLKLFTTQLQNQNPLDPTKNEAFVAQLAQFSQLEATTNMATQLTALTASLQGDRMMQGAALIGKNVVVPGNAFEYKSGQPVQASIDLPNGADGLQVDVLNSAGQVVSQQILGAQQPGSLSLGWSGEDGKGGDLPEGAYRFRVTAVSQGKNISPAVSTLSTIRSISQDTTGDMLVQVQGGQTLKLADIKRIGG